MSVKTTVEITGHDSQGVLNGTIRITRPGDDISGKHIILETVPAKFALIVEIDELAEALSKFPTKGQG